MNAVYLGVLWIIYYSLHSAMASQPFKKWVARRLKSLYPFYRSFYSFIALLNFFLLLWFHLLLPSKHIFQPVLLSKIIGIVLIICGIAVVIVSTYTYGIRFFLVEEKRSQELKKEGLNAFVRHPLYFGTLLILLGLVLISPLWKNLLFGVISTLYIIIGTLLEERKLIRKFGKEYLEYRDRVPMLLPYFF